MKLKKYKFDFYGKMVHLPDIDDARIQGRLSRWLDTMALIVTRQQNNLVDLKSYFIGGESGEDFDHSLESIELAYHHMMNSFFDEIGELDDFNFDYYEIDEDYQKELTEYECGFRRGKLAIIIKEIKFLFNDLSAFSTNVPRKGTLRSDQLETAKNQIEKTVNSLLRALNGRREE